MVRKNSLIPLARANTILPLIRHCRTHERRKKGKCRRCSVELIVRDDAQQIKGVEANMIHTEVIKQAK